MSSLTRPFRQLHHLPLGFVTQSIFVCVCHTVIAPTKLQGLYDWIINYNFFFFWAVIFKSKRVKGKGESKRQKSSLEFKALYNNVRAQCPFHRGCFQWGHFRRPVGFGTWHAHRWVCRCKYCQDIEMLGLGNQSKSINDCKFWRHVRLDGGSA